MTDLTARDWPHESSRPLTRHTIGSTEHLAPRGAYRTLCGKSTELSNRRKAYEICSICADEAVTA